MTGSAAVNPPNVLIIADEPEFAHTLMARWHSERVEPAFTVISSDLWHGNSAGEHHIAIVGPVRGGRLSPVLKTLDSASRPTICIAGEAQQPHELRDLHPRVLCVEKTASWPDVVITLATEGIRRVEMMSRARKAEQLAAANQRDAVIGRYMLEQRHGLNNALTSILGNAELLLLEPPSDDPQLREQLETIQTMSLQMREILHRMSSLATELQFEEKQSLGETKVASQSFVSGT